MLSRPHLSHPPAVALKSSLGTLYAFATSREHMIVSGHCDTYGHPDRDGSVTLRGVPYRVTLHLFRTPDGMWTHVRAPDVEKDGHSAEWKARQATESNLHAVRRDGKKGAGIMRDGASDHARAGLLAVLVPVANSWAHSDEGKRHIREAEVADLNNRLGSAEKECDKLRAALERQDAERLSLVLALRALDVDPYAHAGKCRWCDAKVEGTDACAECEAARAERKAKRVAAGFERAE